ncbi:MAG TPA: DUF3943 domain-containing protein [Mucilaginibacter sp.]
MKLNCTNKTVKKIVVPFCLVNILIGTPLYLFAQIQLYQQEFVRDTFKKTSINDTSLNKKRFGRASIQLGLAEVLPWTFDKFLKRAPYANISFKSAAHNLKPSSWTWDQDNFQTNQFGHPYHGSLFYSAFRANGYSFWQAAPATFVGSYLWETFGEKDPPAPNDLINTGFGGVVLGEMTYRLSNKIINKHRRGFRRQLDEVLALLINPMNGLTRILDGKWGKVANPNIITIDEEDSSEIGAEFDMGLRKFNNNDISVLKTGHLGWYGRARLLYGTPYENYKTPFSNISITAEFGQDDSTKVNIISVYGSLTGWLIQSTSSVKHLAIISANYDYIHNSAFFYGGQSVKLNLFSEFVLDKGIKLNTAVGAGPVILAAIPDPYIFNGRNYDYGPGFAINGSAGLNIDGHLFYSVNYRGGWMETLNGNSSHYFLHTVTTEFSYMFIKGLAVSAEAGYFALNGTYKNYPDQDKRYPYLRTSLRYSVNF